MLVPLDKRLSDGLTAIVLQQETTAITNQASEVRKIRTGTRLRFRIV